MSKQDILHYSRQDQIGLIHPWFEAKLDQLVDTGVYPDLNVIEDAGAKLERNLRDYSDQYQINTAVIGLSGGVDSALTAAMFKSAGYNVKAYILPIEQNPEETERAIETAEYLNLDYELLDLTATFKKLLRDFKEFDADIDKKPNAIRRANLKVRLRMMTLYNMASKYKGLVASTDNFSELAAGFWTLHGDVGDVAPIQSLCKSWEVPRLAASYGIPESTVKAKPTDGLGFSKGDEDQFGFSYLEFDIVLLDLCSSNKKFKNHKQILDYLNPDSEVEDKVNNILLRIRNSIYKRNNPLNLEHPLHNYRFTGLQSLDTALSK